eukprot:1973997-Prymnesium_polylepis.2
MLTAWPRWRPSMTAKSCALGGSTLREAAAFHSAGGGRGPPAMWRESVLSSPHATADAGRARHADLRSRIVGALRAQTSSALASIGWTGASSCAAGLR